MASERYMVSKAATVQPFAHLIQRFGSRSLPSLTPTVRVNVPRPQVLGPTPPLNVHEYSTPFLDHVLRIRSQVS